MWSCPRRATRRPVVRPMGNPAVLKSHELDVGGRQPIPKFSLNGGDHFRGEGPPDVGLISVVRCFPKAGEVKIGEYARHGRAQSPAAALGLATSFPGPVRLDAVPPELGGTAELASCDMARNRITARPRRRCHSIRACSAGWSTPRSRSSHRPHPTSASACGRT